MQTDIYIVDKISKSGSPIFNIINENSIINKVKSFKPKYKNEYTIYVHNNLYLIIDIKSKIRTCKKIENIETALSDNILYTTSKITNLSLDSFPIINNYDDSFNRVIVTYDNNISLVNDIINNKKIISFLRIENNIDSSIQIIDKLQ
ncbi:hypothetical protein Indivirus_3_31 [Indivirus ILV1]|uniref:Uncharacterized protein n=1 Tax=Indivirus ILV1 TaxID=1977633 RepID=A0A1V0SDJ9_9VIRU|nr:hypothetical protein Indivirus_3_31 [Indivirus ILV1]